MTLKHVNPNNGIVIVSNLLLMSCFYEKIMKIEFKDDSNTLFLPWLPKKKTIHKSPITNPNGMNKNI